MLGPEGDPLELRRRIVIDLAAGSLLEADEEGRLEFGPTLLVGFRHFLAIERREQLPIGGRLPTVNGGALESQSWHHLLEKRLDAPNHHGFDFPDHDPQSFLANKIFE